MTGMCVLAGCDFLPSISGIGIAKAHTLISKYRNIERVSFICLSAEYFEEKKFKASFYLPEILQVLSVLKIEKGNHIPEGYIKSFREALAVFQHAQM